MSDFAAAIRSALIADASVLALIGSSPSRVWYGSLPDEQAGVTYVPAIVVTQMPAVSEYTYGGKVGIAELIPQVDCWAETRASCVSLSAAVNTALSEYDATIGGVGLTFTGVRAEDPLWDPKARLWRCSIDFTGWGTE